MSKLLVIGASGLTGFKVARMSTEEFETFGTYNIRPVKIQNCPTFQLDKTDRRATYSLMERLRPDVVIDTAALHYVDYCEAHKEEAWQVNVEGLRNVAEACGEVGARMIFISTDYVFDGKKGFYSEEDEPHPLNYYAKTKLAAEKLIERLKIDYAIARPSVIYGWNSSGLLGRRSSSGKALNFAIWTINKLRNREKIKIVTDQYSSPTLADNLAQALLALARSDVKGVYHTAGKICINRFGFAKKIAKVFKLDENLIEPVTSDFFKQVAERPEKCCLDVSKAERDLGVKFMTVEEGLMKMRNQMLP